MSNSKDKLTQYARMAIIMKYNGGLKLKVEPFVVFGTIGYYYCRCRRQLRTVSTDIQGKPPQFPNLPTLTFFQQNGLDDGKGDIICIYLSVSRMKVITDIPSFLSLTCITYGLKREKEVHTYPSKLRFFKLDNYTFGL